MANVEKMFLVFAGDDYYPCGGWDDFVGSYPTLHEAKEAAVKMGRYKGVPIEEGDLPCDWWHIVDLTVMAEVENSFGWVQQLQDELKQLKQLKQLNPKRSNDND